MGHAYRPLRHGYTKDSVGDSIVLCMDGVAPSLLAVPLSSWEEERALSMAPPAPGSTSSGRRGKVLHAAVLGSLLVVAVVLAVIPTHRVQTKRETVKVALVGFGRFIAAQDKVHPGAGSEALSRRWRSEAAAYGRLASQIEEDGGWLPQLRRELIGTARDISTSFKKIPSGGLSLKAQLGYEVALNEFTTFLHQYMSSVGVHDAAITARLIRGASRS